MTGTQEQMYPEMVRRFIGGPLDGQHRAACGQKYLCDYPHPDDNPPIRTVATLYVRQRLARAEYERATDGFGERVMIYNGDVKR